MTSCLGSVAENSRCPVGSSGIALPVTQAGYSRCVFCVSWAHPPTLVQLWLLLAGQWEGFTQSVWWCSNKVCSCLLGSQALGFPGWCRPRSPCMSCKAMCRWLLLVLGVEVLSRNHAVNLGWLLVVPAQGPLSKMYGDWGLTEADSCFFERI